MAFELPPLPSFNVQIPDLQQKAVQAAQLKNMLSEMSLRQALAPSQIQQQQAAAQQAQQAAEIQRIQLQDSQIMSDYLKTGDVGQDAGKPSADFTNRDKITAFTGIPQDDPIMGFLSGLAKKGYSGPGLLATAQSMLQKRNEYNKGTEELQTVQKNDRLYWQDEMAALHALPADQRSAQLAAKLPGLVENSKSDPRLQLFAKELTGHPEHIDEIYNTVAGENFALDLRKKAAEATEAEQKVISPGGTMSPQQQAEVNKQVAVETNPQVQAGKLALATAEARAREQVQASMLPLMEDIRQQYANQKDARDKIETTVLKPYQDKMTDITTARAAIAQANSNPVAARAAIFKMIGVAQPTGSHRVIPAEITAFKYPGGITDQVQERFKGFLTGEPWTDDIADAANAFINGQATATQKSLNSGIDRNNKLYNTTVGQGLKSYSFDLNGTHYENVPEEIYKKYKGQKGFSE